MDFETICYEFSPYIYACVGVISLFNTKSTLSIVSGLLLLAAAATILKLRWTYRRKIDQEVDKAL
jgi:hypothetical protein